MRIRKFKFKTDKNNPNICIDCSLCTKSCDFLTKYDIDLKDFSKMSNIANECCLCEQCYNVCPKDISGQEIALSHRQNAKFKNPFIKIQKTPYIYGNNSDKICDDLIFFGCNFPAAYPKTTKYICENLCDTRTDFSVECCGKPLLMSGYLADESVKSAKKLFDKKKVKRIITACPNCYHFLKNNQDIEVVSIYTKLKELNLMREIKDEAHLFFPCSERNTRYMFDEFKDFLPNKKESFLDINCCGAGGGDKKIAKNYPKKLKAKDKPNLYVYCATCAMSFKKGGVTNIKHLTTEFLGINEEVSLDFVKNSLKMKFYKRKNSEY
ncbi:(Fe-S)-binding protein [Campylobacter sp. FMV-PI01]|uniref:(Fe-S)-binding protein n=1 Tax=Campylobacter portucalensis TaxID=2608384 RepID=A0A6L5WG87_9BACT|nr:heterodisulfide reductase-related iron-sulfur binding cluster [Campylobacter portucalensis]MSN96044.1 (Fe-S)-binding protein [Campylobacter portucalensis]